MNAHFLATPDTSEMVRLFVAKTSPAADNAIETATQTLLPFLIMVHSDTCGHCVRMMPAFKEMLTRLGDETQKCVVQIKANALHEGAYHPLISLIKSTSIGVPYFAVVKPSRGITTAKHLITLPDESDRTAKSLESFARKHMTTKASALKPIPSSVAKKSVLSRKVVVSLAKVRTATKRKIAK